MLMVKEVADRIGAKPANVRKWAREGRFKGAKQEKTALGSYWLIPETSAARFERRTGGRPRKDAPSQKAATRPRAKKR